MADAGTKPGSAWRTVEVVIDDEGDAVQHDLRSEPARLSDPRLMTVDEVAEFLGVRVRFVRRVTLERRLPHIKVGRHVRVDPEELRVWLGANRVQVLPARRPA